MEITLAILFVITIIVYAIFEIFLILTDRPTISTMVRNAYKNYPPLGFLVALVVGLILGHFFWQ